VVKTNNSAVYAVNNPSWLEKKVWGREKGSTGNVL
jgi:hypothetical protein